MRIPLSPSPRQIDTDGGNDGSDGRLQLSALEIIVQSGEVDLLNTEALIQVLESKWKSHARGYFYMSLVLYVGVLAVFTILCRQYRFGLGQPNPSPILKLTVQTANYCSAQTLFSTIDPNTGATSLVPGSGNYNCNIASGAYSGSLWDRTTSALELATFVGVWVLGALEAWDHASWFIRRIRDSSLLVMLPHLRAPRLPSLFPIPGTDIKPPPRMDDNEGFANMALHGHSTPVTFYAIAMATFQLLAWRRRQEHQKGGGGSFASSRVGAALPAGSRSSRHAGGHQMQVFSNHLFWQQIGRVSYLYWSEIENMSAISGLLWVFIALVTYHYALWFRGETTVYNPELAVAAVAGYLYLLYFAPGFQAIGHFQVIISRIFTQDLLKFVVIYMVFLTGFSLASFMLIRSQYVNNNTTLLMNNEFGGFGISMIRLFRHSLGDMAWDVTAQNEYNDQVWCCAFAIPARVENMTRILCGGFATCISLIYLSI